MKLNLAKKHDNPFMAPTGSRLSAVKQQFEYAYLFGVVCINNSASEAMVVFFVNKNMIEQHLLQISQATKDAWHAVVIDGVGWHADGNDITSR